MNKEDRPQTDRQVVMALFPDEALAESELKRLSEQVWVLPYVGLIDAAKEEL